MKKPLFSALLLSAVSMGFAQEESTDGVAQDPTVAPEREAPAIPRWTKGGNASLIFSQAAFNNDWTGGGTNNIAASLAVSYAFSYKKDRLAWNNNLYIDYGLTKLEGGESTRKTTDRFKIDSVLGYQMTNPEWFYPFFFNFKTQMTDGYKYTFGIQRDPINQLLSPGYVQLGSDILWKKSDNLRVDIAPATPKITTARSRRIQAGSFCGVEKGKTTRYELDFSLSGYARFNVMDNVSFESILSLYSSCLDKPQNIDIDYTANLVMTINKYLSVNLTFQIIHDDDAAKAFQIREVLGLGVTHKF